MIYPDGSEVQYEYDALDSLVKVTDREGKETGYTYDLSGYILTESVETKEETRPSSYGYDAAWQLAEIVTKDQADHVIQK